MDGAARRAAGRAAGLALDQIGQRGQVAAGAWAGGPIGNPRTAEPGRLPAAAGAEDVRPALDDAAIDLTHHMKEHPFQGWVEKTAKYSGVLACGVRLSNQSTA